MAGCWILFFGGGGVYVFCIKRNCCWTLLLPVTVYNLDNLEMFLIMFVMHGVHLVRRHRRAASDKLKVKNVHLKVISSRHFLWQIKAFVGFVGIPLHNYITLATIFVREPQAAMLTLNSVKRTCTKRLILGVGWWNLQFMLPLHIKFSKYWFG